MYIAGVALMIGASFALYLLMPAEHRTRNLLVAYFVFVCLHHAVSVLNVVWAGLPGADLDAHYFHLSAARALEQGTVPPVSVGTGFYEWILYGLYWLFGSEKLLAQSLSVLLSGLACVIVVHIARQLGAGISAPWVVVLFTITPSVLFFTSLTFREVFQMVGLAGSCLFLFRAIESRQPLWFIPMLAALLFMGLFHHVLLAMGIFLFAVGLSIYIVVNSGSPFTAVSSTVSATLVVTAIGAVVVWQIPASSGNNYVEMLQHSGGIREMIQTYRGAVDSANPRSSYGFTVQTFDAASITVGLARSYVSYLTGPWVGEVDRLVDVVPFVNSVMRMLAVICVIFLILRGGINLQHWYLLFVFVVVTLMWSIGTTNFGQAFRHNTTTDWILPLWLSVIVSSINGRRKKV